MIKNEYDVVIIGGGFSGIVAANELANKGLEICILEENDFIGGQLLRRISNKLGKQTKNKLDYYKKQGLQYIENIKNKSIEQYINTLLIGVYSNDEILIEKEDKEVLKIKYKTLLFATGARERFLPFKGWTLPGVYSNGMLQVMMKGSGIIPSKRILIGGTGLFLFAVGYEILKNGGKVIGILEQSGMLNKLKMLPLFFDQFSKFAEGGKFLTKIYSSFTPVLYRRKIIEARGKNGLEEVIVAKVNGKGKIITGTEKIYKTDTLGIGYGFTPNIEGPVVAGCKLIDKPELGGWVVDVDKYLATSIENIFAAGEITGIGGAQKSICEGKLSAISILNKFDKIDKNVFDSRFKKLSAARKKHLKFSVLFNTLYPVTKEDIFSIPDDTIICRCEDVTMGTIKKAVSSGLNTFNSLKIETRATMGNCQGRTCGRNINDLLKYSTDYIEPISFRTPIKPVSLKNFIGE